MRVDWSRYSGDSGVLLPPFGSMMGRLSGWTLVGFSGAAAGRRLRHKPNSKVDRRLGSSSRMYARDLLSVVDKAADDPTCPSVKRTAQSSKR